MRYNLNRAQAMRAKTSRAPRVQRNGRDEGRGMSDERGGEDEVRG
jgi:hypothetical protein